MNISTKVYLHNTRFSNALTISPLLILSRSNKWRCFIGNHTSPAQISCTQVLGSCVKVTICPSCRNYSIIYSQSLLENRNCWQQLHWEPSTVKTHHSEEGIRLLMSKTRIHTSDICSTERSRERKCNKTQNVVCSLKWFK